MIFHLGPHIHSPTSALSSENETFVGWKETGDSAAHWLSIEMNSQHRKTFHIVHFITVYMNAMKIRYHFAWCGTTVVLILFTKTNKQSPVRTHAHHLKSANLWLHLNLSWWFSANDVAHIFTGTWKIEQNAMECCQTSYTKHTHTHISFRWENI